jgi:hypothetical protein
MSALHGAVSFAACSPPMEICCTRMKASAQHGAIRLAGPRRVKIFEYMHTGVLANFILEAKPFFFICLKTLSFREAHPKSSKTWMRGG